MADSKAFQTNPRGIEAIPTMLPPGPGTCFRRTHEGLKRFERAGRERQIGFRRTHEGLKLQEAVSGVVMATVSDEPTRD